MTYHDHYGRAPGSLGLVCLHSWEDFTNARLTWLYGTDRAELIRDGLDLKTEEDRLAWDRVAQPTKKLELNKNKSLGKLAR